MGWSDEDVAKFNFAAYLTASLEETILGLVHFSHTEWLLLIILCAIIALVELIFSVRMLFTDVKGRVE